MSHKLRRPKIAPSIWSHLHVDSGSGTEYHLPGTPRAPSGDSSKRGETCSSPPQPGGPVRASLSWPVIVGRIMRIRVFSKGTGAGVCVSIKGTGAGGSGQREMLLPNRWPEGPKRSRESSPLRGRRPPARERLAEPEMLTEPVPRPAKPSARR